MGVVVMFCGVDGCVTLTRYECCGNTTALWCTWWCHTDTL